MFLNEFNFHIEHVSGRDNKLPDALSGQPNPDKFFPGEPDLEGAACSHYRHSLCPHMAEEIADERQLNPLIASRMEQWVELRQNDVTNPRDETFLKGNQIDEKGLWRRCHQTYK